MSDYEKHACVLHEAALAAGQRRAFDDAEALFDASAFILGQQNTIDSLRAQLSEAQARLAEIAKTAEACIERLEAEGYSCKAERDSLWAVSNATPVSPASQVAQGVADDVVRDAERWRYARRYVMWDSIGPALPCGLTKVNPQETDAAIDAALLAAAQQQKAGGA